MFDLVRKKMSIPGRMFNGYYSDKEPSFIYMERTGLVDRAGNSIYEGDIVKMKVGENEFNSEVVYNLASFKIKFPPLYYHGGAEYDLLEHWTEACLVVGNIYEGQHN